MPGRTKAQEILADWEYKVAAMGIFEMHDGYDVSDVLDKNVRFTGFLEQRVGKMISLTNNINPFCNLNIERDRFTGYWWDTAMEIADGDEPKSALPRIINPSKADKRVVYGELIPAYRALKDSFDKRWWFEWIFNHKQYTTERDSIKALKGVMMALTGDDAEVIDRELEEHRDSVPTSGVTPEERKAMIKQVKDKRIREIKRLKVTKWLEKNEDALNDSRVPGEEIDNPIDDEIGNLEWGQIYNEIKQEYKEMLKKPMVNMDDELEIIEDAFNLEDEVPEYGEIFKDGKVSENGEVSEDGEARESDNVIRDNVIFEEGEEEINLVGEENENESEREKVLFEDDELEKINASFEVPKYAEDNEKSFQAELRDPMDLLLK